VAAVEPAEVRAAALVGGATNDHGGDCTLTDN
jgi:hypothetical protein